MKNYRLTDEEQRLMRETYGTAASSAERRYAKETETATESPKGFPVEGAKRVDGLTGGRSVEKTETVTESPNGFPVEGADKNIDPACPKGAASDTTAPITRNSARSILALGAVMAVMIILAGLFFSLFGKTEPASVEMQSTCGTGIPDWTEVFALTEVEAQKFDAVYRGFLDSWEAVYYNGKTAENEEITISLHDAEFFYYSDLQDLIPWMEHFRPELEAVIGPERTREVFQKHHEMLFNKWMKSALNR